MPFQSSTLTWMLVSVFDISKDLSLSIEPTILDTHTSRNPLNTGAVGVQCNIKF